MGEHFLPNFIKRRVVVPFAGRIVLPLIQSENSIETTVRRKEQRKILKTGKSKLKETIHRERMSHEDAENQENNKELGC